MLAYCKHCQREVSVQYKGRGLYCKRDHFVPKRKKPVDGYEDVREHINARFYGKGYSWDEIILWCQRAGYEDLEDLCYEMQAAG